MLNLAGVTREAGRKLHHKVTKTSELVSGINSKKKLASTARGRQKCLKTMIWSGIANFV